MSIKENFEDINLSMVYRGLFWIKDISNCEAIYVKIQCNSDGKAIGINEAYLNSKHGDNYNHEKTWAKLEKKIKESKPFDYYPRGRVEINNGVAKIFLNPNINQETIIETIKKEFNLLCEKEITKIKVIPDYSEHYYCYLDEE